MLGRRDCAEGARGRPDGCTVANAGLGGVVSPDWSSGGLPREFPSSAGSMRSIGIVISWGKAPQEGLGMMG